MASKKHVADAAAYTFLELQNMYSARLVCHADSSSTFQTKLCNMILHDTIDIQNREDANRCSSYVELVVPNYNFNGFSIKNKLIFEPVPIHVSIWNMGHLCFACFENPFLFLDEKSNKTIMWFRIIFQIHLKEMCPCWLAENAKIFSFSWSSTDLIKSKLYIDDQWMVLYKVYVFYINPKSQDGSHCIIKFIIVMHRKKW